ncbi:hypothetical protein ig2599ANME_0850 [groundwater metagenome]
MHASCLSEAAIKEDAERIERWIMKTGARIEHGDFAGK